MGEMVYYSFNICLQLKLVLAIIIRLLNGTSFHLISHTKQIPSAATNKQRCSNFMLTH